jgi:hypothetical protein
MWGTAAALLVALAGVAACADERTEPDGGVAGRGPTVETRPDEPTVSPVPESQSPTPGPESPSPLPPVPESPSPTVETRIITETQEIAFTEEAVEDPSLAEGTQELRVQGMAGEMTLTYEVTLTDGVETGRELLREEITREPVTQVVASAQERNRNAIQTIAAASRSPATSIARAAAEMGRPTSTALSR